MQNAIGSLRGGPHRKAEPSHSIQLEGTLRFSDFGIMDRYFPDYEVVQ